MTVMGGIQAGGVPSLLVSSHAGTISLPGFMGPPLTPPLGGVATLRITPHAEVAGKEHMQMGNGAAQCSLLVDAPGMLQQVGFAVLGMSTQRVFKT